VIVDCGGGQIKAVEVPRFITLDGQLQALPPAHPVLGLARPLAKGSMLARSRHGTDGQGRRILQDNGISALPLPVAREHQRKQGSEFDTVPSDGLHKLTIRPQRRELVARIRLDVKVHFGLVRQSPPSPPRPRW
jgi:hypothetical protein